MCPKSASKTLPLLLSSNIVDTNGPVNFSSKQPGINKLASRGFPWSCEGAAAESRSVKLPRETWPSSSCAMSGYSVTLACSVTKCAGTSWSVQQLAAPHTQEEKESFHWGPAVTGS